MFNTLRIPSHARSRRFVTAAVAACLLAFTAASAAGQSDAPWLHVQVEDESDRARVEVNLPLAAVEALSDRMGREAFANAIEHADHSRERDLEVEELRALWQALRDEPGAWVSMDDDDGGLRARMDGDEVRITTTDEDGSLNVRFPTAVGDALFADDDGELDFAGAVRRLADHEGDLVVVDGGDGRVRVWIGPQ